MTFDLDTFPSVQDLVIQIEDLTGKNVEFIFNDLPNVVLGNLKIARGSISHHIIIINNKYSDLRHSIASLQMRFIIERSKIKSEEKDISPNPKIILQATNLAMKTLGSEDAQSLAKMVIGSIITQLMSVLPGTRVHRQIQVMQPELDMQHQRMMKTLGKCNLTNINQPKLPIPDEIFKFHRALLAVENLGLSLLVKDNSFSSPFKLLGLNQVAEGLIFPLLEGNFDNLDYRELVDLSSETIGMNNYYHWIKT